MRQKVRWLAGSLLLAALAGGLAEGRLIAAGSDEEPLTVGWATADITPARPVALVGQLHKRISTGVRDPLTATALALETRGPAGSREQALLVSCDLVMIQREIQERLRERLRPRLPDLDPTKIVLLATHTHTGPGLLDRTFGDLYDVSGDAGVMKASEYAEFFLERVSAAAEAAWGRRAPAQMGWALSHTPTGWNRRAVYTDGRAVMYGDTRAAGFSHLEGGTDTAVDLLFFWCADAAAGADPTGVVINLACPSQETENLNEVSADFWHETREVLRRRFGAGFFVLPQCAPSGDLSPHPMYRHRAEQVMDERRGLTRRQEIARRVAGAVEEGLPPARVGAVSQLIFRHRRVTVDLPEVSPDRAPFYVTDAVQPCELHVLRLGEVAMATNPFELFHDYGVQIEARSPAILTMLVQIAGGQSGYLPTTRAVQGGGYSADRFAVGPEGGQRLVEATVRAIEALY